MSSIKPAKKTRVKSGRQTNGKSKVQSDTRIAAYGILGILAVILYYYCRAFDFIQDDSFITFRYVKNFTEGNGLVFNLADKVEGYTCFLWVMVLSFVKTTGFDFISSSQTLGIIFSLFTLLFTYLISSKIFPKNKDTFYNIVFSFIAVMLVAVNGSFAYWTVSGMETGMFGFFITLGVYLYLKEINTKSPGFPYSSLVFLLAALSRPEGNLVFAVTVIHRIIITLKQSASVTNEEKTSKIKLLLTNNNILWIGVYLVPGLIFMLWRYTYYGYLLPNTFYAKTGSSIEYFKAGFEYFWIFAKDYGGYGILVVLTLFTLRSKERFYDYLYLVMIFFIFSAYVIFVGGDVLRPNRFFVPMLPGFYILVQEGLSRLIELADRKKTFKMGALTGLIFAVGLSYYTYKNEFEQIKKYSELEKGLVEKMKISGSWLKSKQMQEGKPLVVAATTIGAISYYSDVTLIDMLGLTDKEVAHNPQPIPDISSKEVGWRERNYNVGYVLSRKPDYIYFSTGIKPSAFAERGLFTADDFMKYYYPYYFTIKEYNFTDIMYKRKSDAEAEKTPQLPQNPDYNKSFVNLYNQAMNTQKDRTKLQEAISLYHQALASGPAGWGTPYQMIGDIYMQMKENDKAAENYAKALELDDYNVMAHYNMYQVELTRNDTATAMMHIYKIKKYTPELLQ